MVQGLKNKKGSGKPGHTQRKASNKISLRI